MIVVRGLSEGGMVGWREEGGCVGCVVACGEDSEQDVHHG